MPASFGSLPGLVAMSRAAETSEVGQMAGAVSSRWPLADDAHSGRILCHAGRNTKSPSARDELYARGATLVGQIHCPSHFRARPAIHRHHTRRIHLRDRGLTRRRCPCPITEASGSAYWAAQHTMIPACAGRLACDSGAHSPHSSRGACTLPRSLWEALTATIFPFNVFAFAHDSAVR